jgi:hypothetical protein
MGVQAEKAPLSVLVICQVQGRIVYKEGVEARIRYMKFERTELRHKKDFCFPDGGKVTQMHNLRVSSTWNWKTVRLSLLLVVLVGVWGPVNGRSL